MAHTLDFPRRRCDDIAGCNHVYSRGPERCPRCGLPEQFSYAEISNLRDYIWDIETYPNCFLATFRHVVTRDLWTFEVSDRRNDMGALYWFAKQLQQLKARAIGFNSLAFDYPVLHWALTQPLPEAVTAGQLYDRAMYIIRNQDDEGAFSSMVWESDWIFEQVDLFKIHHFDNEAKRTSLKALQFAMNAKSLEDLPFPVGTILTFAQMDDLRKYNIHDVDETLEFYFRSAEAIEFREQVSSKYGRNFMNHNDTKIGKDFFIMRLEESRPGSCYGRDERGRRVKRQTKRDYIHLSQAVFPYVKFERPEFQRIRDYFVSQVISETKGVFKDLNATVNGFTYVFGAGGIHGSVDSQIIESDDHYQIEDVDVSSYYPSLAIVNRLHPAHIGDIFADIYGDLKVERKKHKKGTLENATLKLALNGTFGDTGSKHSPLFDPLVLLSITINGQLLLCMLAEQLIKIPGLSIIQVNTDGVTVRCPKIHLPHFRAVCEWWQKFTLLELEFNTYQRMFIRDVNNYIAEGVDGKIKRKGAYAYMSVADGLAPGVELDWHKNHSGRVIARAAEAALLDGDNVRDFIRSHPIERDFYMLAKVPRSCRLIHKFGNIETEIQGTSRYYVSNSGGALIKIMPPLKGKTDERRIGIDVGYNTTILNNIAPMTDINFEYYVTEAMKLITPLKRLQQGSLF